MKVREKRVSEKKGGEKKEIFRDKAKKKVI